MKRLLTILFLLSLFTNINAQFDTEHWFAPIVDRTGGQDAEQYLYLSTNRTTPFTVEIYNNNTLYKTISISKGNPGKINIDRNLMITENQADLFTPNKMGLHLVGEFKFFAHFRFAVKSHAEIITSKGKAALGKTFFTGMVENSVGRDYINSMVGITANENNTSIKISGYKSGVIFSNGNNAASMPDFTITLNKGESYIFDIISNASNDNLTGLIGAKIESNKPISVTNGNFDAISPNKTNIDITMDQSIPIERLGKQYVVMNGNGSKVSPNPNFSGMEKTLIIATEDNTNFYINNNTTPISITKAGEYKIIESTDYVTQSTDVFNLYINSDKKVYVYQNLAGNRTGTEFASAGFNIIPALDCLLPNKIDEFGFINEIGNNTYDTKLNIIAEKGAKVYVNRTQLTGNLGPFPISGNSLWESYFYPNATDNITVSADKAITAGIAAGNGAVGYGGYFAGFNSNPIISKGGDCNKNNITLEVDDTYDSYQWYYNGSPYTGTGANTYIISPTESGEYFVKIVKIGCGTLDSPTFDYLKCPLKTNITTDISNCNPIYTTLPVFTSSPQSVDINTLVITNNPTNGSVSINPTTGEITYTLTNFSATTDSFTYSFSGTDPRFPDTEFITVNININYLRVITGETFACIKPDQTGDFDLTQAKVSNDINITKVEYFENYDVTTKTFSNPIANFTSYNSIPKTIYAKVTNSYGCTEMAEINLNFYPIPNIDTLKFDSTLCDTDFDGLYEPDFDEISKTIVNNSADFDIYYFDNPGFNFPALPKNWTYTTPTRVYILVASRNGCTNATGFLDFKIGTKITVNNIETAVCDNERDGKTNIKISDYLPSTTSGTQYFYYNSLQKAQEAITGTTISNDQEITNNTTFYIRTENPGFCPNIFELQIIFNQPNVSRTLKDKVICKNTTTTVDAGTGFTYYKWSNGTEGATLQTATYGVGTHYVELTSTNGCVYKQSFTISEAVDPVIDSVIEQGNSITVNVSGGTAPYEYSLEQINWQKSNFFDNLRRGVQKVYVRDANICTPIEYEFSIINLINAITPNGDGINDVLDYSDLRVKKDVKISIFDRFGKKVYSSEKQSNYIWNGTENGRSIITGTYWYVLEWTEPDTNTKVTYKNWIIVKNRN